MLFIIRNIITDHWQALNPIRLSWANLPVLATVPNRLALHPARPPQPTSSMASIDTIAKEFTKHYYSMFDSNKLNNKFNIFTYIYTPSTKFLHNRPYFFSKTPNSTKFQVSSFIDGIKKNTSITDYYTAFLNRYHLKHIVKGINNSNVKKVEIGRADRKSVV